MHLKKTVMHLIWGDPSKQWGVRGAKGDMDPQIRSKSAKSTDLICQKSKINGGKGGYDPQTVFFQVTEIQPDVWHGLT